MLKKSTTFLFLLLLSAFLFTCSKDDTRRRGRMTPQERAQQLKEALDLTDQQTQQVTQIYTEMGEEISRLRDEYGDDRGGMRDARNALREKTDVRINELLTVEQKEKYQTYQEERRERMRDSRDRGQGRE